MNNSRNKFIAFLTVFLVLFTTFAYSALSTSLTITSNARFKVMANIRVDDIGLQSTNNSLISYDSEYTKNTISSGFKLTSTSSSINYNVVISNTGNIDQVIYQINTISSNNDGIIIYIDDEPMNDKLPYKIPIGNTTIKITYKTTNPSNQTINIVNQFDFRKLYTVDYNTKGGSQIASQDKIENVDLTLTNSTPTKAGYTFAGWTDEENGTTAKYQAGSTYTLNESVILYAIYSRVTYNITYTLNGGTNHNDNPSTYNVETNDITLKDASKTGWTFTGWTGNGTSTPTKNLKLTKGSTGNKTFVAHFEKTITLTQKHGGTTTTTQTYNLKDSETEHTFKLQNTTNSYPGWTFIGWLDDPTPKVQDYAPTGNITISNDKTVYATYKKELTTTFIDYTGITKQTRTVKGTAYGNNNAGGVGNQYPTVTSLTVSNYTDWTKLGWTTSTSASASVSLNSNTNYTLTDDKATTYYALYKQDVTLSYNANGGSTKPNDETKQRKVNSYSNVTFSNPTFTLKNTATKTGYTLSKWTISAPISADKNPTDSITIESGNQVTATAKWTANTYTIAYTLNGGNNPTTKPTNGTYDSNVQISNPTKTFTVNIDANNQGATIKNASGTVVTSASSNQTFAGWTSTVGSNAKTGTTTSNYVTWDGTSTTNTYFKNLTDTNNGTVTLTANWTAVNVTLPNIAKTGYTCGYAASANGTSIYQTGGSYTPSTTTNTATLFAKCNANTYTVTYNGNGNTDGSTTSSSHTYDTAKNLTKNGFTKTGYTFAGWNTKADGTGTAYLDEASVTNLATSGNVNLYAQWTANTYTVAYTMNGAAAKANQTVSYDSNLTLTKPTKTFTVNINANSQGATITSGGSVVTSASSAQTFAGWTGSNLNASTAVYGTTASPSTSWNGTTKIGASNEAIYLKNLRTTSGTVTLTANWTAVNVTLPNITKTGYTCGYATSAGGNIAYQTGGSYTPSTTTGSVTLFAKCTPNTYTVTYNGNGNTDGSTITSTHTYNVEKTLTKNGFTKTGYTFAGWNTKADGSGTNYEDEESVTNLVASGNFNLYAIWAPNTNTAYTVYHYIKDLGANTYTLNNTENKTGTSDASLILANLKKTITGFTYSNGSLTGSTSGPGTVVTTTTIVSDGTRKIYLFYTRDTHTVTLTKGTGINTVTGAGTYEYGASVTINNTLNAGYNFVNWTVGTTSTAFATSQSKTFTMGTSDVTYKANGQLVTYNITYNLNGGSVSPTNPTSYNVTTDTFTLNNPTKTGYTFDNWSIEVNNLTWTKGFINSSNGNFETVSSYPNSYYSNLIRLENGKTYKVEGIGSYASSDIRWRAYNLDGTYYKNAYSSNYWTPDKDCYVRIMLFNNPTEEQKSGAKITTTNSDSVSVIKGSTGNKTYTANYTAKTYTLTLKPNGGKYNDSTSDASKTMTYDSTNNNSIGTASKTGYTFTGWWTASSGGTQVYNANGQNVNHSTYWTAAYNTGTWKYDGAVTLYAQFTKNDYSIAFNSNAPTGETVIGSMANLAMKYDEAKNLTSNGYSIAGYTFAGWNTKADGTGTAYLDGASVSNLATTGTVTLYAQWTINTVTIGLQKDGSSYSNSGIKVTLYDGTTETSFTGTISSGSTITFSKVPAKTYNIYVGKDTNHKTTMIDSNVDVVVNSSSTSQTVKFYTLTIGLSNTTTTVNGTSVSNNGTVVVAEGYAHAVIAEANTGYEFVNNSVIWTNTGTMTIANTKAASTTVVLSSAGKLTSTATAKSYVVTAKANDGSIVSTTGWTGTGTSATKSVTYKGTYGTLPSVSRTGYTLVGWNTKADGTGTTITASTTVNTASAHDIYAIWVDDIKPTNLVITNSSNGNYTNQKVVVTISATEQGTGIKEYQWYEGGAWTTRALTTTDGVGTITYTANRNETIRFRAVDNAGNISDEITTVVKIDKTQPTIVSVTASDTLDLRNYVEFNATDSGSEIIGYNITSSTTAPTTWIPVVDTVEETTETKYELDAAWARVFHHNNHWGTNGKYFADAEEAQLITDDNDKYSVLQNIANYKNTNNFEFLLQYPGVSDTQYNRWTQTANPITTNSGTAVGYTAVGTPSWTTGAFAGISKSYAPSKTFLDGSPLDNTWYYAIGSYGAYYDGMPGPATIAGYVNLWSRIDNFTTTTSSNLTRRIGDIKEDGTYYVWVKDAAGNTKSEQVTVSKVDTELPTATITSTNKVAASQTITLTLGDNKALDKYYFGTSNPSNTNLTYTSISDSPTSYTPTATVSSNVTAYISVVDKAGNKYYTSKVFYKTTLNANDGSVSPARVITIQGNSFTLPTPTRTGYTFGGWYTDADLTSAVTLTSGKYKPNGNVTLYAKWIANTYTVTYNGNNNTSGSTATSTHTYDVEKTLTGNGFIRTGYTFGGWSTSSSDKSLIIDDTEYHKDSTNITSNYQELKQYSVEAPFTSGEVYQLEFDAKGTGRLASYFYGVTGYLQVSNVINSNGVNASSTDGYNNIILTSSYKHYSVRFTLGSTGDGSKTKYVLLRAHKDNDCYAKNIRFFKVSSSSVAYTDEQSVINLATTENVNLYAMWLANELTFGNQTITKTFSKSSQTANVTAATNGTGTYTYSKVSGESDITVSSAGVITIPASKTVNTTGYSVVIRATDSNSGMTKDATYTIKVNKKKGTVTLTDSTKALTYGTNGTNTYSYDGDGTVSCSSGDTTYVTCSVDTTNHKINVTPVKPTSSAVTITVSAGAGTNYSAADNKTFTVTVGKGTLTATATPINAAYTGSAQYAKIKVTKSNWDGKTIVSGTTTSYGTTVTSAGAYNTNYDLKPGYTNVQASTTIYYKITGGTYYNDLTGSTTIAITQTTTTTSLSAITKTYNGSAQAASGATAKLANNTAISNAAFTYTYYNGESCSGTALTSVPVAAGIYSVKATLTGTTNYATSTSSCAKYTMNKRDITVTAASSSRAWNGSALTNNTCSGDNLVSGHTVACTMTSGSTITNAGSVDNVISTYSIKSGTTDLTSNYNVTTAKGTLTVTVATPTVSLTSKETTYTGSAISANDPIVSPSSSPNITYTYYTDSSCSTKTGTAVVTGLAASSGAAPVVAGQYYVIASAAAVTNKTNAANSACTSHKITTKAITVTAGSSGRAWNGSALTNSSCTANTIGTGDSVTCAMTSASTITNAGSVDNVINTVTIKKGTTDVTSSYSVTKATGTLTVIVATPTVTLTAKTDAQRTYTGSAISANDPTVSPNSSPTITKKYYTNSTCTTGETTTAPTNYGTYYAKAYAAAVTNKTAAASSACVNHSILKAAATNSVKITGTNTWGSTLTATITTNSDGAKSYKWYYSSTAGATSGGTAVGATNCNTGSTCVIPQSLVGKYIYVVGSVGAGTNWNAATDSVDATDATTNTTQAVAKKTCPAPTNVAISTDKKVSWTNASGASSYQISMSSSSGFAAHTNGAAYNSITAATGTRTVYVRSVCDTTYYTAANSANASKSTTVYSVTLTAGTGISSVSGAGNYITGASASIDATVKTGYTWSNWTGSSTITTKSTSVTVNNNKSYTANTTINSYVLTVNPNGGSFNGSTTNTTYTQNYDTLKVLPMPTRTGYTFAGWTKTGNGTVTKYGVPKFNEPLSMSVYNNSNNGTVTHTLVSSSEDSPVLNSTNMLKITTSGTASPGLGGFVQSTISYENAVFYHVIVAKIPVGYTINDYKNATGTERKVTWLTSQAGTGKFEVYIYKHQCGSTGTFSSFGHVAINGTAATSENPVTWYVAYANVFDATTSLPEDATQVYTYGVGNTTLTANWVANELVFDNQTITKTFSTSSQTANVTAATNGTGTYTYSKVSGESDITVTSAGVITIPASKAANTTGYSVVVRATDSNSGKTKDATYVIKINKAANPLSVTASQTWSEAFSTSAKDKAITSSNGVGTLSYTIQSQKNTSGTTVNNFSISGSNLRRAASTPVSGSNYTVVVRVTAAGNDNYNSGYKDITYTVTVSKAACLMALTNASMYTGGALDLTTKTSNAVGGVSYAIKTNGTTTASTLSGTNNKTLTAGAMSDANDTAQSVVITATEAASDNYNTCSKDMTVTVNKNANTLAANNKTVYVNSANNYSDIIKTNNGGALTASVTSDGTTGGSNNTTNKKYTAGVLSASNDNNGSVVLSVTSARTTTVAEKTVSVTLTVQKYTNALSFVSPTPAANAALAYNTSYTAKAQAETNGGTNGAITYASGTTSAMTINSTSGAITIAKADGTTSVITASMARTTTVKAASITRTFSTTKGTCPAPTGLTIGVDKKVSWTNASGASSYQISMAASSGFAAHTNGAAYNSITAATGTRTVYVRSVCDTTYYTAANSSNASKSVTVYSVTLTKGTGIKTVSGAGNYITGATVTLGATADIGYTWSKWTQTSGGTQISTTNAYSAVISGNWAYTANATANPYTVTAKANSGSISATTGWTGTGTSATKSVTYKGTYGTLPTVSKTGYTLAGWNTKDDGTGTTITSSTTMNTASAHDIYAIWVPSEISLADKTLNKGTYGTAYTSNAFDAATNGTGTYTYTLSNAPTGATINSTNRTISFTASTAAGTYNVTVTATDNETSKTDTATMTIVINKRDVTLTAGSSSRAWNGSALTNSTCTGDNLVSGHTVTCTMTSGSTITVASTTANTSASVNNTISTYVIKSGTTDLTSNYNVTTANGTLTISYATPTVTLTAKTDAQRTYTGSAIAANNATVSPNSSPTITKKYYTNSTCTTGETTTAPTNAGAYYTKAYAAAVSTKTNAASSTCVNHSIIKAAATNSVKITGTNTWGSTLTATITTNSDGAKSYKWYYSSTAGATSGGTAVGDTNCNTGSTCVIPKSLIGKYIYVVGSVGAGTNWNAATDSVDATDATTNTTQAVDKKTLSVTRTNYSAQYDGSAHGVTVKVTNSDWDGKTIVSGTTTSYGTTVTSNGAYNTNYTLSPTYTDYAASARTVYYKVTGGTYYKDYTGSGTVTISKKTATNTIKITGTNTWGSTLTATITTNSNGTKSYKWYYSSTAGATSGGTAVGDTNCNTGSTCVIPQSLVGKYIYVVGSVGASTNYTTPADSVDATDATANTTAAVAKKTGTNTIKITGTNTWGSTLTATITTNSNGTKSYKWYYSSTAGATSGGTAVGATNCNTGSTCVIPNTLVGKYIYVVGSVGTSTYYTTPSDSVDATDATANTTQAVAKKTCPAPTNVAIATDKKVSWTNASGASSYQISMAASSGFAAHTNGAAYNSITAATGTRTVYVRSVCDTTYYTAANSANASKSTTVYSVTLTAGTGINSVSGAGNYINGASASINATVKTGYTWTNWTGSSTISTKSTSVTVNDNKSYTANATANTYTIEYDGLYDFDAPTSGTYDSDVIIPNPHNAHTFNFDSNGQGALITLFGNPVESITSILSFDGWTSSTVGSNAKTGTTANPTTAWSGASTTNTYFKNLKESGTVIMVPNWKSSTTFLPNVTKSGYLCGFSSSPTGNIEYYGGQSYEVNTGGETTFYAKCAQYDYTIAYTMNGGELPSSHPEGGFTNQDVYITNPSTKNVTINFDNTQGATIKNSSNQTITSMTSSQTFKGWTSSSYQSNAKTGTTANPITSWTGSLTKNTYFKDLRNSGTIYMVANWNSSSITLPNATLSGRNCFYATGSSDYVSYSPRDTYSVTTTSNTDSLYVRCLMAENLGYNTTNTPPSNSSGGNEMMLYNSFIYTSSDEDAQHILDVIADILK